MICNLFKSLRQYFVNRTLRFYILFNEIADKALFSDLDMHVKIKEEYNINVNLVIRRWYGERAQYSIDGCLKIKTVGDIIYCGNEKTYRYRAILDNQGKFIVFNIKKTGAFSEKNIDYIIQCSLISAKESIRIHRYVL